MANRHMMADAFGSSTCVSGFGHVKTASVSRALNFKVNSDSSGFGHVKSAIPLVVSKPLVDTRTFSFRFCVHWTLNSNGLTRVASATSSQQAFAMKQHTNNTET